MEFNLFSGVFILFGIVAGGFSVAIVSYLEQKEEGKKISNRCFWGVECKARKGELIKYIDKSRCPGTCSQKQGKAETR